MANRHVPAPMTRDSDAVRNRLVEAGLVEFAAHGFNGSSTRSIAKRALTHQPQINYHFGSKDSLWRACLERLLTELDEEVAARNRMVEPHTRVAEFSVVIRSLVTFAARRPELNRIMMHEGSAPSERLDWLVETHLRQRYKALHSRWQQLQLGAEISRMPPAILYHALIGAASLLYANSPEAVLFGIDPSEPDLIEAHADALVEMFLGNLAPPLNNAIAEQTALTTLP